MGDSDAVLGGTWGVVAVIGAGCLIAGSSAVVQESNRRFRENQAVVQRADEYSTDSILKTIETSYQDPDKRDELLKRLGLSSVPVPDGYRLCLIPEDQELLVFLMGGLEKSLNGSPDKILFTIEQLEESGIEYKRMEITLSYDQVKEYLLAQANSNGTNE
jgi:hypothetical protein